jgi:hypothetical protein
LNQFRVHVGKQCHAILVESEVLTMLRQPQNEDIFASALIRGKAIKRHEQQRQRELSKCEEVR